MLNLVDEGGDDKDYSIARKSHQQSAQHNDQVEAIQELVDDDPDRSVRDVARHTRETNKVIDNKLLTRFSDPYFKLL